VEHVTRVLSGLRDHEFEGLDPDVALALKLVAEHLVELTLRLEEREAGRKGPGSAMDDGVEIAVTSSVVAVLANRLQTNAAKGGELDDTNDVCSASKRLQTRGFLIRAATGRHEREKALDQVVKVRILAPQPQRARSGGGLSHPRVVSTGDVACRVQPPCNLDALRSSRRRLGDGDADYSAIGVVLGDLGVRRLFFGSRVAVVVRVCDLEPGETQSRGKSWPDARASTSATRHLPRSDGSTYGQAGSAPHGPLCAARTTSAQEEALAVDVAINDRTLGGFGEINRRGSRWLAPTPAPGPTSPFSYPLLVGLHASPGTPPMGPNILTS
jgi:hypothetical protein